MKEFINHGGAERKAVVTVEQPLENVVRPVVIRVFKDRQGNEKGCIDADNIKSAVRLTNAVWQKGRRKILLNFLITRVFIKGSMVLPAAIRLPKAYHP